MMADPDKIMKRNGDVVDFDRKKIFNAMLKANRSLPEGQKHTTEAHILLLTDKVVRIAGKAEKITVEGVQDVVEKVLIDAGLADLAKSYILYRSEHARIREAKDYLMEAFQTLTFKEAKEVDAKRENANIDANTAMGTMLKYGSTAANFFVDNYILPKDMSDAHIYGDVHYHDKDFYLLTETCCQIDLLKLFENGFTTGHGYLREPNSIISAAALTCIAIQANQNDMHGGQAIPHFDYCMAPYVNKTFHKEYKDAFTEYLVIQGEGISSRETCERDAQRYFDELPTLSNTEKTFEQRGLYAVGILAEAHEYAIERAKTRTDRACYQAMEALVHNFNTLHSRAGAQVN